MSKENLKNPNSFNLVAWLWGLWAGTIVFFGLMIVADAKHITVSREISFQIDPTNIFTILITVYLAVTVLRQLNRRDEGDKLERDLYIQSLRDFHSQLTSDVHGLTVTTGVAGTTVASTIKNLGLALQETLVLINMSPCDNKENITLLNNQFSKLRNLLTYVPHKLDTTNNVVIKSGNMIYSSAYITSISRELAEFKKILFLIILKINRS